MKRMKWTFSMRKKHTRLLVIAVVCLLAIAAGYGYWHSHGGGFKAEQLRHGKEFRLINPALRYGNAIFSESQDVVSFLLDAPWPFPYISANENADGC
jgi:hypothetical protein